MAKHRRETLHLCSNTSAGSHPFPLLEPSPREPGVTAAAQTSAPRAAALFTLLQHSPAVPTSSAPFTESGASQSGQALTEEALTSLPMSPGRRLVAPPFMDIYKDNLQYYENLTVEEILRPTEVPIGCVLHLNNPHRWGVVMISNIPYTVTRQEVTQFLGRTARLISPLQGCPIHIIMERSTGKTMDCYAEFVTHNDARETVSRINRVLETGSTPRMGSRHVEVSLSSQDELLKALFPRTKCISWVDGRPIQLENKDEWSTGFNGFLTDEELFCVLRHAEMPHRSAFASKVPQRTYESIISTIWKFPWFATNMYTTHARKKLYDTLRLMILALVARMQQGNTVGLDQKLLNELVQAGLKCPAFNSRMKYTFAYFSNDVSALATMPADYVVYFPFDALVWLPQFDFPALQSYAQLIANGRVSHTEREGLDNHYTNPNLLRTYGTFWFEWNEQTAKKKMFNEAVNYEKRVLRELLITGFKYLSGKQSSASSIGTAPKSVSPTPTVLSVDSQRTVSASRTDSVAPSPAIPHTPRSSATPSEPGTPASHLLLSKEQRGGIDFEWKFPPPSHISSQCPNADAAQPLTPGAPSQGASPHVHPPSASTAGCGPTYYKSRSASQSIRSYSDPWAAPTTVTSAQNAHSYSNYVGAFTGPRDASREGVSSSCLNQAPQRQSPGHLHHRHSSSSGRSIW